MKNMPWRKIPLGRLVTIFCFVMLGVAGILLATDSLLAQGEKEIEVLYESDKTQGLTINEGDETEIGSSQMIKEAEHAKAQQADCETANIYCKVDLHASAQVNTYSNSLVGRGQQAVVEAGSTVDTSVLNFLVKGISTTYTPPASGTYYVADMIDNLGISDKAYAQGFGFYGLQPFLTTWKIMRNFAYMIFAVVIIGVAISILVRQTFSSKNALTIQQVLPNIIIALIAITFSYAIAGFMIDIMYWIMYAVGYFVQVNTTEGSGSGLVNELLGQSIWGVLSETLKGGMSSAFSGVNEMVNAMFGDHGVSGIIGDIVGGIAGALAALIMIIVVIVMVFKLFFILAKSYVYVIMYTIFSPFILSMQVFNSGTFKKWVLSIAANLSPFVLTFFMLLFQGIVQHIFVDSGQSGWIPPFMISTADGLTSGGIGAIIILGMILSMNEIITEVKKKIGGGGGFFEQMGGIAQANAKKAWDGAPGKFGRATMGAGMRLGGSALAGAGRMANNLPAAFGYNGTTLTGMTSSAARAAYGSVAKARVPGTSHSVGGLVRRAGRNIARGRANIQARAQNYYNTRPKLQNVGNWLSSYGNFSMLRNTATNLGIQYSGKAMQAMSGSALRTLPVLSGYSFDQLNHEANSFDQATPIPNKPGYLLARNGYGEITTADQTDARNWLKGAGSNPNSWAQSGWQLFSSPRRRP